MIEDNVTFDAPVPGQSLVTEPKGYAWERPPQIDKVEDAMAFYMNSLGKPQIADDIFTALDEGFPLDILIKSILSNGVMEGIHSVDISLLIHPILVELVHAKATLSGLKNIRLHAKDKKAEMNKKEKQILVSRLQRAIDKMDTPDECTEILEQSQDL